MGSSLAAISRFFSRREDSCFWSARITRGYANWDEDNRSRFLVAAQNTRKRALFKTAVTLGTRLVDPAGAVLAVTTEVQLCIVHLVRASLNYVPWKHRKLVAADLRRIYRAATAEQATQHLEEVPLKWNAYPSVSQVWQRNWDHITPFFRYPADIRKAIYTTNSVEALHRSLRKIIETR